MTPSFKLSRLELLKLLKLELGSVWNFTLDYDNITLIDGWWYWISDKHDCNVLLRQATPEEQRVWKAYEEVEAFLMKG